VLFLFGAEPTGWSACGDLRVRFSSSILPAVSGGSWRRRRYDSEVVEGIARERIVNSEVQRRGKANIWRKFFLTYNGDEGIMVTVELIAAAPRFSSNGICKP